LLRITGRAMIARHLLTRPGRLDKPDWQRAALMLACMSPLPFSFPFVVKMPIPVKHLHLCAARPAFRERIII
jgi:hypothetical protein